MRTLPRVAWIGLFLLLASCSGQHVHKARVALINQSFQTVVGCVGVPNKTIKIDETTTIVEWDYDENKVTGSLSMTAIAAFVSPIVAVPASMATGNAFSITGAGNCRAVGTFTENLLMKLRFGGDNTTLMSGRDGVCEPLFRGCLENL